MRRRMTNWVNYDPWVIGVLEPILLLLCIALIGAVLGLLCNPFSAASLNERLAWVTTREPPSQMSAMGH